VSALASQKGSRKPTVTLLVYLRETRLLDTLSFILEALCRSYRVVLIPGVSGHGSQRAEGGFGRKGSLVSGSNSMTDSERNGSREILDGRNGCSLPMWGSSHVER
jgi:hypothetical protein